MTYTEFQEDKQIFLFSIEIYSCQQIMILKQKSQHKHYYTIRF